jgi:hypothetical protein
MLQGRVMQPEICELSIHHLEPSYTTGKLLCRAVFIVGNTATQKAVQY